LKIIQPSASEVLGIKSKDDAIAVVKTVFPENDLRFVEDDETVELYVSYGSVPDPIVYRGKNVDTVERYALLAHSVLRYNE
jgi:hypothetical protein